MSAELLNEYTLDEVAALVATIIPTWDQRRGDRMLLKLPQALGSTCRCLRLQVGDIMLPDWSLEDFSLKWDMKERAFEVSANPMLRPMLKNLLGGAELGACEALIDEGSDGWSLIIKATWSLTPFGQMGGIDPYQYTQCLEGTACQYQSQHVYLPAAATRSLQFLKQGEPWPPVMSAMAAFTLDGQLIPIQQPVLLKTVKATARYDMQGWQGARLILKHATLRCCSRWLPPAAAEGAVDGSSTAVKHEGYVIQPGLLVVEAVSIQQKQAAQPSGDGTDTQQDGAATPSTAGQQQASTTAAATSLERAGGAGSGLAHRWGTTTRISRRDYEGCTVIDSSLPAYFTYSTVRPTVNLLADLQLLDRDTPDEARPVLWAWVAVERDGSLHPAATYVKFTPQQTLHLYCMSGWKGIGKLLSGIDPAVRLERWVRPAPAAHTTGTHESVGTANVRRAGGGSYAPPQELLVVRAVTSTQPYKFEHQSGQDVQEVEEDGAGIAAAPPGAAAAEAQLNPLTAAHVQLQGPADQLSGGGPAQGYAAMHQHQQESGEAVTGIQGSQQQHTKTLEGLEQEAQLQLQAAGAKRKAGGVTTQLSAGEGLLLLLQAEGQMDEHCRKIQHQPQKAARME